MVNLSQVRVSVDAQVVASDPQRKVSSQIQKAPASVAVYPLFDRDILTFVLNSSFSGGRTENEKQGSESQLC